MNHKKQSVLLRENSIMPSPSREELHRTREQDLPVIVKKQNLRFRREFFHSHFTGQQNHIGLLGVSKSDKEFFHGKKGIVTVHDMPSPKIIILFLSGVTRVHLEVTRILESGGDMLCYLHENLVGQFRNVQAWGRKEAIITPADL